MSCCVMLQSLVTEGLSLNGDFSRGVQTSPTNVTVPEEAAKASDTAIRTLRTAVAWHFLTWRFP